MYVTDGGVAEASYAEDGGLQSFTSAGAFISRLGWFGQSPSDQPWMPRGLAVDRSFTGTMDNATPVNIVGGLTASNDTSLEPT